MTEWSAKCSKNEPRHVDRARYLPPSELSNGGKYLKKEKMGGRRLADRWSSLNMAVEWLGEEKTPDLATSPRNLKSVSQSSSSASY